MPRATAKFYLAGRVFLIPARICRIANKTPRALGKHRHLRLAASSPLACGLGLPLRAAASARDSVPSTGAYFALLRQLSYDFEGCFLFTGFQNS